MLNNAVHHLFWRRSRAIQVMDANAKENWRPSPNKNAVLRLLPFFAGAVLIPLAIFLYAWQRSGHASLVIPYLSGKQIVAIPQTYDLGALALGSRVDLLIEIVNLTPKAANITGASSSCTCLSTRSLPKPLQPNGQETVAIEFQAPSAVGYFSQTVLFYLEVDDSHIAVPVKICGSADETR